MYIQSQVDGGLGNQANNLKVTSLILGHAKISLCPCARHFTLLASGGKSLCIL